jgi:putative aldouronate transport system permease protein
MTLVVVITVYPFLNVLAKSFNDPVDTLRSGITIWPRIPTYKNYTVLFTEGSNLGQALKISVLRTAIGSLLGVLCCTLFAYPLSRSDFIFRKAFMTMLVITLYVSG